MNINKKLKTMNKILILIMIVPILMFISCQVDTEEIVNTHDDAYVDVLTKKMTMMGSEKYVLVFFAGGEGIDENGSNVKTPDGTVYNLTTFWASPGILTGLGNVQNALPQSGTYTFTLKFDDGYVKTITDILEGENSTVPSLTVVYNQNTNPQTIDMTWSASPEADFYCVKLIEIDPATGKAADAQPLYKVPLIEKNITSHIITFDGSNGWMRPISDFQNGANYLVVISAKKVENGTPISGSSRDFEINAVSTASFTYQQ